MSRCLINVNTQWKNTYFFRELSENEDSEMAIDIPDEKLKELKDLFEDFREAQKYLYRKIGEKWRS